MGRRRLNWVVLAVGLLFAVSSLYWDVLRRLGVTAYVDWLGAIGSVSSGMYYFAVGGMYLLGGTLTLILTAERKRDFRWVCLGTGVSLLVIWGALLFWWPSVMTVDLRSVATTLATGPVLLGLLIGAASVPSIRLVVSGIAVVLLVPYASMALVRMSVQGGPASLGGFFNMFSIVLFAVLDAIWAYPLYRLGRTVREN